MYSVNAALHKDKASADVEKNCRKARMFGRKVRLSKVNTIYDTRPVTMTQQY